MENLEVVRTMLAQVGEFHSEPLTDFSLPENAAAFEAALARVRAQFGHRHPLVIGAEEILTEDTLVSTNPAHPDQIVAIFSKAGTELALQAMAAAEQAFETWSRTPATERAAIILRAAALMRARKHEMSAWMVYEVGKNWVEADADTAEAIDFLEYYARQMLKLELVEVYQTAGERDTLHYIPLGVGAVIPPWNFPLAIPTGMSSAAIVAGNTIVFKPSSDSAKIAWEYFQILREAGLPAGVCNFFTGPGAIAGETLVDHPKTRFIAFTGSKEVGLRINERAAKPQPGQIWIKRTILEMGGKDAVVVDETADLDAAARGIVISAFGFQGQKCSAGSRAIIVAEVYDALVQKILEQARQILVIGDPEQREHYTGPVVSKSQYRTVLNYIEIGKGEGKLLYGGKALEREGYFIEPAIFIDVPPDARISQEEIFGPVLTVIKADDWQHAIAIANGTEFGLTGAYYSTDPERLAFARREFHVGNLYFNRKCTGALVGIHPFGGFNMSGTDSKAGGPDYLLLFTQAKSIAEKL
ncbi:MAG: L-glutamate gamma-semialdehyde dehydrogenase [Anaerolineae bacterium]|jgi:1-pyrroline-5-carboxylate dehydrogenase|nr:L-glutamate gamma-semialdehyde dehydrogenase [Anaerolineae bacterium]